MKGPASRWLIAVVFISAISAVISLRGSNKKTVVLGYDQSIYETPLVRVLAIPEKYEGKFVYISGFSFAEFEDSRLYLSIDDLRAYNRPHSIKVGALKKPVKSKLDNVENEILETLGGTIRVDKVLNEVIIDDITYIAHRKSNAVKERRD